MFREWLKENSLRDCLIKCGEFAPYPKAAARDEWERFSDVFGKKAICTAEEYLQFTWPIIPASDYMNFRRTGNRKQMENWHFARRYALQGLVLGECFEHKGRFLDQIINGIWAICEETFWGLSAHNGVNEDEEILPNVENQYIDLFAAETGDLLAWTLYLLEEELNAVTPMVCQRIRYELNERILKPFLFHRDFWWQGYLPGRRLNNWTPWILSNVLAVYLIACRDDDLLYRAVNRSCHGLEEYLATIGEDGGCDEGVSYWNKAGASLFDCLDLLKLATGGKLDFGSNTKIRNIARYVVRAHIAENYYVNFADCPAIVGSMTNSQVFRFGKYVSAQDTLAYAASRYDTNEISDKLTLLRTLPGIFANGEITDYSSKQLPAVKDDYLADLQVMIARTEEGFFLAAKGGNNAESHNHNDVGSLLCYLRGIPLLIDVGVEVYSRKTFSAERYSIWTMQSSYHNLPELNGCMQLPGEERRAEQVSYAADGTSSVLTLDIASAYPAEACIKKALRSVALERTNGWKLTLTDAFAFAKSENNVTLNFMSWKQPIVQADGSVIITLSEGSAARLACDGAAAEVEKIEFHDANLGAVWKDETVYRIRFAAQGGENITLTSTLAPI